MRAFGGRGKTKNRNKSRFSISAKFFDIFIDKIYPAVSCVKIK